MLCFLQTGNDIRYLPVGNFLKKIVKNVKCQISLNVHQGSEPVFSAPTGQLLTGFSSLSHIHALSLSLSYIHQGFVPMSGAGVGPLPVGLNPAFEKRVDGVSQVFRGLQEMYDLLHVAFIESLENLALSLKDEWKVNFTNALKPAKISMMTDDICTQTCQGMCVRGIQ